MEIGREVAISYTISKDVAILAAASARNPPFCTGGEFYSAMVSWRVQIEVICSCPRMAAEICGYMGSLER